MPGKVAGTGKVPVVGYEADCGRNGSNAIKRPPSVNSTRVAERLAFLKKASYSDADFVPAVPRPIHAY